MDNKEKLFSELQGLPKNEIKEVYDFVVKLKQKNKESSLLLAETALEKEWSLPQEDEAWKDL